MRRLDWYSPRVLGAITFVVAFAVQLLAGQHWFGALVFSALISLIPWASEAAHRALKKQERPEDGG